MTNEEIVSRLVYQNQNGKFSVSEPFGTQGGFSEFETLEEASTAIIEYIQRENITFE
jgi:hypothetical protein